MSKPSKLQHKLITAALVAMFMMAFGTIWTAYESHVTNEGVHQWLKEFKQIRDQSPEASNEPLDPDPKDMTKHEAHPEHSL